MAAEAETGAVGRRRDGAVGRRRDGAVGRRFLGTASGLNCWRNRDDEVELAESAAKKFYRLESYQEGNGVHKVTFKK